MAPAGVAARAVALQARLNQRADTITRLTETFEFDAAIGHDGQSILVKYLQKDAPLQEVNLNPN